MKYLTGFIFALCFAWMTGLWAAEADQEDTDAAESADIRNNTTAPASETKPPAESSEEFTPSEEISEDFAVSFPVDI